MDLARIVVDGSEEQDPRYNSGNASHHAAKYEYDKIRHHVAFLPCNIKDPKDRIEGTHRPT